MFNRKYIWSAWAALFALCLLMGFFGSVGTVSRILGILFFLPPAVLLYHRDIRDIMVIRSIAILNLGMTLLLTLAGLFSVRHNAWVGQMVHILLGIFSAPMFCFDRWAISLFCWACVMIITLKKQKGERE